MSLTILTYVECSKSKLTNTTDLELLNNDDVHNVSESIKLDNIYFVDNTEPSVTWSAVILQFESCPLLDVSNTNTDIEDIINGLSENFKRVYGALLCTSELLIEFCPRNGPVVVQSLYKALVSSVLHGHSNSTSFILNIVQDYKMYFPYAYTFSRRIGRNPHMTLQQWRDCLFPEATQHTSVLDNPMTTTDWDMSGLEEGEDSDGEDQKSINDAIMAAHQSPQRRRATRMTMSVAARNGRSGVSTTRQIAAGAETEDDLLLSSADSLLEIQDMSLDDSKGGGRHQSTSPLNRSNGSGHKAPSSRAAPAPSSSRFAKAMAAVMSSSEDDNDEDEVTKVHLSPTRAGKEEERHGRGGVRGAAGGVTLGELRTIFDEVKERGSTLVEKRLVWRVHLHTWDGSCVDCSGVYCVAWQCIMMLCQRGCRKLARSVEYNTDIAELAASVRGFHDIELSWDELKDLAKPYMRSKEGIECSLVSMQVHLLSHGIMYRCGGGAQYESSKERHRAR